MPFRPLGDLLIQPDKVAWVEAAIMELASDRFPAELAEFAATDSDEVAFWTESPYFRPYLVKNGVLTIPVAGLLLNGFPFQLGGTATGYEYIEAALARGMKDDAVDTIILDINSPGGYVSGCFDCADAIFAARGKKPILAFANDHAYSAAYAIASSADEITVTRTGGVGSIGVIAMHADMSEAIADRGIKITFVYAGKHKKDGNSYEPLSPDAKARFQARVDSHYEIFVSTVARNRGMDEAAVRETEAATFLPRESVEANLADRVGNLGDILSALAETITEEGDDTMSKDNTAVAQAATPEALAAATAEATQAGKAEGHKEGTNAERARISAILDSEEAKTRPVAARAVAFDTDKSADDAKAFLGKLPAEKSETQSAGASSFETAMNHGDHPNLGTSEGKADGSASRADGIFASAGFRPMSK